MGPVAAVVALLVVAHGALALDDELLSGTTLALHAATRGRGERLVVVARVVLPAPVPGASDDPRIAGLRVEVGNPSTHEWARLEAPAAGWSLNALGTVFRFRNASPKDRPGEPLRAVLRHGKGLKVVARAIGITLDEPSQRSLAVVLTSGSRRYCLLFGGTLRRDEPGRFVAHAAPVPSRCPALAPSVQTTTTSTSVIAPPEVSTSTTTKSLPTPTSTTADPCRDLDIPSGHRPPRGQCRIWFPGRSPGHQPPAGSCDELAGDVPPGACLVRG